jgi:hypothetical protein
VRSAALDGEHLGRTYEYREAVRIRIRIRMFIFLLRLYKTKCILLRHFKLDYKPPAACDKYGTK